MELFTGRVSAAVAATMRAAGIERVFGNPGTMELPVYDELTFQGIHLDLALHEVVAVGAAAGYSAAGRRPAMVMMHTIAGLGNGAGMLHNAERMELPIVVLVGTPDARNSLADTVLNGECAAMARPVAKWAFDVKDPTEVTVALRRALSAAMAPPRGPAVIAVPMNYLLAEGTWEVPSDTPVSRHSVSSALDRVAEALLGSTSPLLVSGAELSWDNGVDAAVDLAERIGATVMSESLNLRADFPSRHPSYAGVLPASSAAIAKVLSRHDVVVMLGSNSFRPLLFDPGYPIPDGTRVFQLDDRPEVPGRRYPIELGLVAGLAESVRGLVDLVAKADDPVGGRTAQVRPERVEEPKGADALFAAMANEFTDDVVYVDDSSTMSWTARRRLPRHKDNYFAMATGGLGLGPGFALGVALADPSRRVIALVGDGSIMYATQALWSAAREQANLTYVVLNNGGYESLRQGYRSFESKEVESGQFLGTTLSPPTIDYVSIAQGHGVPASRVTGPVELIDHLKAAALAGGPHLVEVLL